MGIPKHCKLSEKSVILFEKEDKRWYYKKEIIECSDMGERI